MISFCNDCTIVWFLKFAIQKFKKKFFFIFQVRDIQVLLIEALKRINAVSGHRTRVFTFYMDIFIGMYADSVRILGESARRMSLQAHRYV